jgi:diguanylate cyclase (GGDEF)-like protein
MKVLIADDEPVSRRLLESSLKRWGYEVLVASDGLEATRMLRGPDAPKLVIFDWMMPGRDGIELCREVRARKNEPYTYILLLTAKRTKAEVVEGLDAGADDYITKPFDPQELKVRLRTGKRILYLQDQLIAVNEALREMAMRDPLTGLWNRAAALDRLTSEVSRSARHGTSVGLMLCDLDYFKGINDTHGHLVGDAILCEISRCLRRATRRYDAVARFGGEEFLVILPGCDRTNAMNHAERVRASIAKVAVDTPMGKVSTTMSLGVTVYEPGGTTDPYRLIQVADEALYRAKRLGRDRCEFGDATAAVDTVAAAI